MQLYEHQLSALNKMKNGCILCGGVGSGKSITSLAYYYLRMHGDISFLKGDNYTPMDDTCIKDLYIITTARKRDEDDWNHELAPFLLSSKDNTYSNKIIIDSWNNISKYTDVEDAFFIFDEQRVIGNGKWVKTFINISKKNEWLLLSATPGDSWMDYIPVFIANGFYKNRTEFIREHVVYSRFSKFPTVDRYINTGRLIRLRNSILITMDFKRSTVSHVEDVIVDYDIIQYKYVVKNRKNIFKEKDGLIPPIKNASEFCQVLRRIVNTDESRQVALLEIFEKHPRVIIFYNFDYELDILKNINYGSDVEIREWNGYKHQPIPDCDKWVYLVQYNAGAEGWNCIKTDTVIFYSLNYSYKIMKQSMGRIDRLNTPFKDLYYYNISSRAWIDIAIKRAIKEKKKFNESSFVRKIDQK